MRGYIYKVVNWINKKVYVGQTYQSLDARIRDHACRSDATVFHRALCKYGLQSFEFQIIDKATTQEVLDEKEMYWIKKLKSLSPNGYNMTLGGERILFTNEVRAKLSAANKGRQHSFETRAKMSAAQKGKFQKGKPHSLETRAKISAVSFKRLRLENGKFQ